LRVLDDDEPRAPPQATLADKIVETLTSTGPQTPRELRAACGVRMARVYDALRHLADDGRVVQDHGAYQLA
jgi:predicted transcriptional regulator